MITEAEIETFQRDGAVVVRGVLSDWIEVMAEGRGPQHGRPRPLRQRERSDRGALLR